MNSVQSFWIIASSIILLYLVIGFIVYKRDYKAQLLSFTGFLFFPSFLIMKTLEYFREPNIVSFLFCGFFYCLILIVGSIAVLILSPFFNNRPPKA